MQNIIISTECVADLSKELRAELGVQYIYYDIKTEEGVFRDNDEIDALNIIEYMSEGKKKVTSISVSVDNYYEYFTKLLEDGSQIVHICISDRISEAYTNSNNAKRKLGEAGNRIRIVDSRTLSSGIALLAIEATKLKYSGKNIDEIANELEKLESCISTSFIAYNADYLYYNGQVSKKIKDICSVLRLHPVLYMNDGKLKLKGVYFGDYDKASEKYVRSLLRKRNSIDVSQAFLTYAGCGHKKLERIREVSKKYVQFEQLYLIQASATISCNCGPNSFGIIFKKKVEK